MKKKTYQVQSQKAKTIEEGKRRRKQKRKKKKFDIFR